jgi:hypothetical protein
VEAARRERLGSNPGGTRAAISVGKFLQKIRNQAKLASMNNPSLPHAESWAAVSPALSRRPKREGKNSPENLV